MKNKLIIIIILIIFVFLGFSLINRENTDSLNMNEEFIPTEGLSNQEKNSTEGDRPREAPEGFEEFKSNNYNFSLFYPDGLSVEEYDEGGGASTITFQNIDSGLGFQIFIVPYYEDKITDERFYRDVPSGVRENLENKDVDGAMAAFFDSQNVLLGQTKEVWFINDGFLYEVSTIKDLESWLLEIMETWQFLN